MTQAGGWRRCNLCKEDIGFNVVYWVCSVSTCNRRRTQLHFCSVGCYDAHLPGLNHKESWAIEVRAPQSKEWATYAKEQGDDAVWPPVKKEKLDVEAPLPSGGFGSGSSSTSVVRRKKTT